MKQPDTTTYDIRIPVEQSHISGNLVLVANSKNIVIFAHGSGSSRHSSRNIFVSKILNQSGFCTFLFDLLTPPEEAIDVHTRQLRFDINLLAQRLLLVTKWITRHAPDSDLDLAYFGASTGAAAALMAAAQLPQGEIKAVVSRGGRPDLAGNFLTSVTSPTLLIVGQLDAEVITLNEVALAQLQCEKKLSIVNGASHLFEEDDTLEQAALLARDWFKKYMT